MISLAKYIQGYDSNKIDGHIHLFNHKGSLNNPYPYPYDQRIGFMDLEFDVDNLNVRESYKRYITNDYNKKDILLATSTNIDDIIYLLDTYEEIKGIGELKCYDKYQDKSLPYKDINFVSDCCQVAKQYNVPIYLHWELNSEEYIKQLKELLQRYNEVNIVLCHCGFGHDLNGKIFDELVGMMSVFNNLWVDISYTALDFFDLNINRLQILDKSRVILGTDFNNKLFGPNHTPAKETQDIIYKLNRISKYIDSDTNIKRLFNLT